MIREAFYRLLTPCARPLVGFHPNAISAFSLVTGCLAGVAYWLTNRHAAFFILGAALVLVSAVADALDGIVARLTDRTTRLGDFLDHFFDRVVDVAVMLGVALSPHASLSLGLAATILVLLNGYLGTQIMASFGSRHYSGLGKAQFIVALILGSVFLGIYPETTVAVEPWRLSLVDLLMVLVGLGSLHAMTHRVRLAFRLAAEREGEQSDQGGSRRVTGT